MGLGITAYSRLFPVARDTYSTETMATMIEHGHYLSVTEPIIKFTETNFPGRSGGIKPGIYGYCDRLSFRAGSYSGYGQFRNWLATVVGRKDARDYWNHGDNGQPFFELIHFADNEGIIGARVAAKLLRDFQHHDATAETLDTTVDKDFIHAYRRWRMACELASDDGCIDFH